MAWSIKAFHFDGKWLRGVVTVPAVNEDLFEDCDLDQAKQAARPRFEVSSDSPIQYPNIRLGFQNVEELGKEVFEIQYKLQDLTDDQDRAVEKLYREVLSRDGEPSTDRKQTDI